MAKQQATEYLLVGDHLGQVKKVLLPSNEVFLLTGCAPPSSSNPVVSIEPIGKNGGKKQLIANKNGDLYIYDSVEGATKAHSEESRNDALIKALPINFSSDKLLLVYEKQIILSHSGGIVVNQKKKHEQITNAQVHDGNKLAFVGKDIPLKLFDIQKKVKLFEAEPPEKDWLGIRPDVYVADLEFVGRTRVATCSKSDSVIRVYDTQQSSKTRPVISIDINQTAFNEHADSARFHSVASTGDDGHTIVVGSNVGQILAIDLRFNLKQQPKKRKMQPKAFKVLGGFKGARGASIKDLKILPAAKGGRGGGGGGDDDDDDGDSSAGSDSDEEGSVDDDASDTTSAPTKGVASSAAGWRVVSCCLDRYLRIHSFTRNSRQLDRHVYMTTKPLCVSACVD